MKVLRITHRVLIREIKKKIRLESLSYRVRKELEVGKNRNRKMNKYTRNYDNLHGNNTENYLNWTDLCGK